jgi:hypothetical protein
MSLMTDASLRDGVENRLTDARQQRLACAIKVFARDAQLEIVVGHEALHSRVKHGVGAEHLFDARRLLDETRPGARLVGKDVDVGTLLLDRGDKETRERNIKGATAERLVPADANCLEHADGDVLLGELAARLVDLLDLKERGRGVDGANIVDEEIARLVLELALGDVIDRRGGAGVDESERRETGQSRRIQQRQSLRSGKVGRHSDAAVLDREASRGRRERLGVTKDHCCGFHRRNGG